MISVFLTPPFHALGISYLSGGIHLVLFGMCCVYLYFEFLPVMRW